MAESENIIEIKSKDQFDEAVKSETLTVIDFWAVWCGPCRVLKPLLHKIAGEHPEIQLLTVDVDSNQELAAEYDIMPLSDTVYIHKNINGSKIAIVKAATHSSYISKNGGKIYQLAKEFFAEQEQGVLL